jgi:hypothetical protein
MVGPIFVLMSPIATNFGSTDSFWPKTDYIYPLPATSRWGSRETRNTWNRSANCMDMRGDTVGAAPSCPVDSIDTISFSTKMKRE